MITKIVVENFKKFENITIDFDREPMLFVGQNNGGKTTALQAISLWSSLAQQWKSKKGASFARKRTGAPISRNELYAAPVRDVKMLWRHGIVQDKASKKINIRITAFGIDSKDNQPWEYGMEVTYSNQELFFCKPIKADQKLPPEASNVFHLPPLSGVQTYEKRMDLGAQLRAIGEGRPGEILRNLLLQLHENSPDKWKDLKNRVQHLFGLELQPIKYNSATDPDISVYYRPISANNDEGIRSRVKFEIASAGSGFLQFLLLAAFLYVHENAVLLIDEPDSHMHVFLQRGMYDWLQEIAIKHNSQLIISTHSEVLVNSTNMEQIVAFFGTAPKKPQVNSAHLVTALQTLSPMDILNGDWKGRIFFAEGDTDFRILKIWAETLKHPIAEKMDTIDFHPFNTNRIGGALIYYNALKEVTSNDIKAFCLRDDTARTENLPHGFSVHYWARKEIENYIIQPKVLLRFVQTKVPEGLFGAPVISEAENYLKDNLTPKVWKNPIEESIDGKGSDFLEKFFTHIKLKINKGSYWEIAQVMNVDEIHKNIVEVLDKLKNFLI